jgi:hypothetical protein
LLIDATAFSRIRKNLTQRTQRIGCGQVSPHAYTMRQRMAAPSVPGYSEVFAVGDTAS